MIKGRRVIVRGRTEKEAMKKMEAKENEELSLERKDGTFAEDIIKWLHVYNKSSLKQKSFDKKECIVKNQIINPMHGLGYRRTSDISSDDLMKLINKLIQHPYSYETVKKTYEVLKQFFDFYYMDSNRKNPMNKVTVTCT